MGNLLGRALTPEERSFRAQLRRELNSPEKRTIRHALRDAAERSPERFFWAGLAMLESETDSAERHRLYTELLECPEFLKELANPDRFDRKQFLGVCRWLKDSVDDFLDLRLARLTPGRHDDEHGLAPEVVLRILEVLHAISSGPRLVQVIGHLARHPHEQIASKATLLLGHRLRSEPWLRSHFQSGDPRVRASVVEGLWGVETPYARRCFLDSLEDVNNRVVGNALFGLYLLGDPAVDQRIERMLRDSRPAFRRTAAWLLGRIGNPESAEALRQAEQDEDAGVRETASQALAALPKPEIVEAKPAEVEAGIQPVDIKPVEATPAEAQPAHEAAETSALEVEPPFFIPKFDGKYVGGSEQPV
jgi:HEAT repeats